MLDIKRIKADPEEARSGMIKRNKEFAVELINKALEQDEKRREILLEVENLKGRRNTASGEIPKLKKTGENVDNLMAEMKVLSDKIKELDEVLAKVEEEIDYNMMRIPNIPNKSVPVGEAEADNLEVRKWGEPRSFEFEAKGH
jgi:seryl-tRNA synthetase